MKNLVKKIANLPNLPGLYFFKNAKGQIIYIGKSINLKNRVKSYWQKTNQLGPWTQKMVSEIANVGVKVLDSEFEALLKEAKLINQYQPYYNIRSKDDKSFLMIGISHKKYPRVYTFRKTEPKLKIFFGPFPSANEVRLVLKTIRRIFSFRSCRTLPKKPCLYYHLKLCPGCCLGINEKDYQKTIKKIIRFLNGDTKGLLRQLTKEMSEASKKLDFENAKVSKRQIEAIKYITFNWQSLGKDSLTMELNADKNIKLVKEIKMIFPQLKQLKRLEAYDISNLCGFEAAGSMVVFNKTKRGFFPNKNQYRKFKIKTTSKPDDVGMIYEIISRRLNHPEWSYPNLIIIDGGKGQINAGFNVLREKNLSQQILILGLTKEEEIIIKPKIIDKIIIDYQAIKLPKNSLLLQLIQQLRDESHRFAKKYHLWLRKKKFTTFAKSKQSSIQ